MGIIGRLTDLLRRIFRGLFRQGTEPNADVALPNLIDEMQKNLDELRFHIATAIRDEQSLMRKIEEVTAQISRLQGQAVEALQHQREDLAREAITRKLIQEQRKGSLEQEHREQGALVNSLRTSLVTLEKRLVQAQESHENLQGRSRRARTLLRSSALHGQSESDNIAAAVDRAALEVAKSEARVRIQDDMNRPQQTDFARINLEADPTEDPVEEELRRLREAPPPQSGS